MKKKEVKKTVQECLIDLYLDVKIRNQEEVKDKSF
jgi:hypothetical protein